MSRDGRRRAWREFSYYPEQEEAEGLYSGLEISEYSDYGNGGNNSINANSDYASPVTEELLLSPLSQRSLEHCEELELDPGEREQRLLLFFKWVGVRLLNLGGQQPGVDLVTRRVFGWTRMQLCGMRMQNSCSLSEATSALLCHLLRGLQCYD